MSVTTGVDPKVISERGGRIWWTLFFRFLVLTSKPSTYIIKLLKKKTVLPSKAIATSRLPPNCVYSSFERSLWSYLPCNTQWLSDENFRKKKTVKWRREYHRRRGSVLGVGEWQGKRDVDNANVYTCIQIDVSGVPRVADHKRAFVEEVDRAERAVIKRNYIWNTFRVPR